MTVPSNLQRITELQNIDFMSNSSDPDSDLGSEYGSASGKILWIRFGSVVDT